MYDECKVFIYLLCLEGVLSEVFVESVRTMKPVKLESPPEEKSTNFVAINAKEFITATINDNKMAMRWRWNGIIGFNTMTNKWRLLMPYPYGFKISKGSISYDPETNKISLITIIEKTKVLVIFNLHNNEHTIIPNCVNKKTSIADSILLYINGKQHTFCGWNNNYHLIYNEENKKFKKIFTFPGLISGLESHRVIYSKQRQAIYMLGGYDWGDAYNQSVWECTIKSNDEYEWKKWDESHEYIMYNDPCILTPDEKYIIIFMATSILCMDVEKRTIRKLGMELSFGSSAQYAILCGRGDEILVSGYVKEVSKEIDVVIPNELVLLLSAYYCIEQVHLILGNNCHYMIPLCDILNDPFFA